MIMSTVNKHGHDGQVSPDADLKEALKDGQYFYAELPGDVVGSRVRLIHRVAEVRPLVAFRQPSIFRSYFPVVCPRNADSETWKVCFFFRPDTFVLRPVDFWVSRPLLCGPLLWCCPLSLVLFSSASVFVVCSRTLA